MTNLSEDNSFKVKKTSVTLKLVSSPEDLELSERIARASKITADCKLYITSKFLTEELKVHIDALKSQDIKLTTLETIVMLLDYTEREFADIERLKKVKKSRFKKFKKFLISFIK